MKKRVSIILATAVLLGGLNFLLMNDVHALQSGFYTYDVIDGKANITKYLGQGEKTVVIPDTLGGYPVGSINMNPPSDLYASQIFVCEGIEELIIPDSVTYIGKDSFRELSCTKVTLPKNLKTIDGRAFEGCYFLKEIILPAGVEKIGECAFGSCSNLTKINIPEGLTSIEANAFEYCAELTEISFPENLSAPVGLNLRETKWYELQPNGVVYAGKIACGYKGDMAPNTKIELKSGTKAIASDAFFREENLAELSFPDSLLQIGSRAFCECIRLTKITLPEGVKKIGDFAFSSCTSLTEINIPNSLIYVGDDAFAASGWYSNLPDGAVYVGKVLYAFKGKMPQTTFNIPEGTKAIAYGAFGSYDGKLTHITFPNSLEVLGASNFANSKYLSEIDLSNTKLKVIEVETFVSSTNLTKVQLPTTLEEIGHGAFVACNSLESITIPDGVKRIEGYAFRYSGLSSVQLSNNLEFIGYNAFEYTRISTLTIPAKVTHIGDFAFSKINTLSEVNFLGNAPFLGIDAFQSASYASDLNQTPTMYYIQGKTGFTSPHWQGYTTYQKGMPGNQGDSNAAIIATPTSSTIYVDGVEQIFEAYLINGNNYFKLRDLAYCVNGTDKCFSVLWDGQKNAILMTSGEPYTTSGGEMNPGDGIEKRATVANSTIFIDGNAIALPAYNIKGSNYFMLRDIMKVFNIGVGWDAATNGISINTAMQYSE